MNQGAIAGAGIAAHLHQHVVPRWAQDANFFPIIAKTKALPQLLGDVRAAIAAAWPADEPVGAPSRIVRALFPPPAGRGQIGVPREVAAPERTQ